MLNLFKEATLFLNIILQLSNFFRFPVYQLVWCRPTVTEEALSHILVWLIVATRASLHWFIQRLTAPWWKPQQLVYCKAALWWCTFLQAQTDCVLILDSKANLLPPMSLGMIFCVISSLVHRNRTDEGDAAEHPEGAGPHWGFIPAPQDLWVLFSRSRRKEVFFMAVKRKASVQQWAFY